MFKNSVVLYSKTNLNLKFQLATCLTNMALIISNRPKCLNPNNLKRLSFRRKLKGSCREFG